MSSNFPSASGFIEDAFIVLLFQESASSESSTQFFLVNEQEPTTLPLDSTTVLQVFMKLACLFSQAVGLFIGEFVGLYIVL